MSPRYCNNPASNQQSLIHHQRREVRTSSDATVFIPCRRLRPGAGSSLSHTPKISSNRITEKASSSGSSPHPQSPGRDECHGRPHPFGTSPHAPTAAVLFKPVVHVHTTLVLPNLPQLQVPGTSSMVDRHSQYSPTKTSSFTYRDAVHLVHRSPPGPRGVGPGDFIQKEHQLARAQSHRSSPRSLPSDVGSQISYDPHGQHSVRIQPEERGRNALSGTVLHSLGHSHQMSESPHPTSCPTSDGDDERSCGQVEQSEQGHPHGMVYRQQCLPSSYHPTRRTRHRSVRNLLQQEASGIRQPIPRPTGLRDRRSEHGLEQSSPGVRISSDANSPQSASENQDFISHYPSDSASLANSILVSGSPQSIRSDPIHDSSVPGTPVPSGGSPEDVVWNTLTEKDFQSGLPREFRDHRGTLPDWYMRESGQSSALGAIEGRVIHSLPLFL